MRPAHTPRLLATLYAAVKSLGSSLLVSLESVRLDPALSEHERNPTGKAARC